jgi:hypothetical protein
MTADDLRKALDAAYVGYDGYTFGPVIAFGSDPDHLDDREKYRSDILKAARKWLATLTDTKEGE